MEANEAQELQEHAEHAAIGDGAAAGDRQPPGTVAPASPAGDAVRDRRGGVQVRLEQPPREP